jgi:hypothetical protein
MPTVALHSHYWQTQTPEPPLLPGGGGGPGYPAWQINIVRAWILLALLAQGA